MSSKEVEQKVLEMRFDNRDFEKKTATTLNTISKLRSALKFEKSYEGVDNIGKAVNKLSFKGMANGVETVRMKFSALEVMGVTALANISNSLINTGRRMVSAFSVEPITTGFNEYELKMGSVQTIMMSTGESLEKVNGYLDELNTYSDKTIYSFQDMTSNIGKFTNAGVKLDDAVKAIQGISNEAAVSGANANEASRAMYNFAQALSAGYVKLIDWKSIENANMATVEFKNQLLETAEGLNIVSKSADGMYHYGKKAFNATREFNDSLQTGWMTNEVLIKTLGDYANAETEIGAKAFRAAQEVKTFSMMMDTLKEAAQSGWAMTWELIIGDYNQSKSLWTKASDFFGGIIDKASDARNELFKGALENVVSLKDWKTIETAGIATDKFKKKLKELAKDHGIAIDDMIKDEGSFANTLKHNWLTKDILHEAIQGMGSDITSSTKSTKEKIKEFRELVETFTKGDYKSSRSRKAALDKAGADYHDTISKVDKELIDAGATINDLSEAQMKNAGFTDAQIKKFFELSTILDVANTPLNQVMEKLERPSGRDLLLDSATTAAHSFQKIIGAIHDSFREFFPKTTSEQLYNLINGMNKLTHFMEINDKDAGKLQRTFKGVFSVLKLVVDVINIPVKAAFGLLEKGAGKIDGSFLDVTATIGDNLVKFSEWADGIIKGGNALEFVSDVGSDFLKTLDKLYKYLDKIPEFHQIFENIKSLPKESSAIGEHIIAGFQNGLSRGFTILPSVIVEIGSAMLNAIRALFQIHSPSRKWKEVGEYTVQGWLNGIADGGGNLINAIGEIGRKMIEAGGQVDFNKIFQYGVSTTTMVGIVEFANTVMHLSKAFENLSAPAAGVGELLGSVAGQIEKSGKKINKVIGNFAKLLKGLAWTFRGIGFKFAMDGIKQLGIALALLVGSVAVLSLVDPSRLDSSLKALGKIALILAGLGVVFGLMNKLNASVSLNRSGFKMNGSMMASLVGLGAAILLISAAVKKIGTMDPSQAEAGFKGLTKVVGALSAMMLEFGLLARLNKGTDISKMGAMLLGVSASLLLMAVVIKKIARISNHDLMKGVVVISTLGVFFSGLLLFSKFAKGDMKAVGSFLVASSAAMMTLTTVMKKISEMEWADIGKGIIGISAFTVIIGLLMGMTRIAGEKKIAGLTGTLFGVSAVMIVMTGVIKMIAGMSMNDLRKGLAVISIFTLLIETLVLTLSKSGKDLPKVSLELIAFSGAVGILAGVTVMLGTIPTKNLVKGLTCIGLLSTMMTMMTKSLKGAQNIKSTMIVMSVAIGIMAASAGLLSMQDPERLTAACGGMSAMMLSFATMTRYAKKFDKGVVPQLIVMEVAVGILAAIAGTLSAFTDGDNLIRTCTGLSEMILSLSGSMALLKLANGMDSGMITKLAGMELVLLTLAGVLKAIDEMDIDVANKTLIQLSGVLIVLTGCAAGMGVLSKEVDPVGLAAGMVGILAMEGLLMVLAHLFETISGMNISVSNTTLTQLIGTLTILTALGVAITLLGTAIGGGAGVALLGGGVIELLIGGLELLFLGLGKIFSLISGMTIDNTKIQNIIDSSEDWVVLCGKMALLGAVSPLAIAGMVAFDSVVANVGLLMGSIGALTTYVPQVQSFLDNGVGVLGTIGEGIGNFVGGLAGGFVEKSSDSLPKLATNLSLFMKELSPFINQLKSVDEGTVQSVKNLGAALLAITGADIIAGISSWLTGGKSLENFGSSMSLLGEGVRRFANSVGMNLDLTQVRGASEAAKLICEAASKIPNSGGLAGKLLGENDVSKFALSLGIFGTGIKRFANNTSDADFSSIQEATNAAKAICEAAAAIPNSDGFLGDIMGNNDITPFAQNLGTFATGITDFSTIVAGNVNYSEVENASNAALRICEAAAKIPNSGGKLAWLMGDNDLSTFAGNMGDFGLALKEFSKNATKVKAKAITGAISSINPLFNAIDKLPTTGGVAGFFSGGKDFKSFASNLEGFGDGIAKFSDKVVNVKISVVSTVINKFSELMDSISKIKNINVREFQMKMQQLAKTGISGFTKTTIEDTTAAKALRAWCETNSKTLTSYEIKFKTAGVNMVQGFINGIKNKIQNGDVYAAGFDLGNIALMAAKKALDEHSPSKKMKQVGEYAILGLLNGLTKKKNDVAKTVDEITKQTPDIAEKNAKSFNDVGKKTTAKIKSNAKETTVAYHTEMMKLIDIAKVTADTMKKYIDNGISYVSTTKSALAVVKQYAKTFTKQKNLSTKATKTATKAVDAYVKKLYKESDYYKQDRQLIKSDTKALNDLYKQKNKLYKDLNKSKDSKTKKGIEKQIKELNKEIEKAKKKIINDNKIVSKHMKKTLTDLKKSIKSTIESYTSLFNVSSDTGIDIFSKFSDDEESKANDIKSANDTLTEATDTLTEAQNELTKAEAELAAAQAKSASVNGRSQRFLEQVAEAEEKVAEARKKVAEATQKQTEAQEALDKVNANTDVSDLLSNMQSQITGYSTWQKNLSKVKKALGKSGTDLYKYLKSLGISGASEVATFAKMTSEELEKAGALWNKKAKFSGDQLIQGWRDKINEATTWGKNLQKLQNVKGLSDAVKEYLTTELVSQGPESSDLLSQILTMDDKQLAKINSEYEEYIKTLSATTNKAVSSLVSAVDTTEAAKKGDEVGGMMITHFNNTITEKKAMEEVKKSSTKVSKKAAKGMASKITKEAMKSIGKNSIGGIVLGLRDRDSLADLKEAAEAIGESIEKSIKKKLKIHSPSRIMAGLGRFAVLGLVDGINQNATLAAESANELADTAVKSLSDALLAIGSLTQEDFDTAPVITPVIDLSDVESGIQKMDGMLTDKRLNVSTLAGFASNLSKKTLGNVVIQNDGTGGGNQKTDNSNIVNNFYITSNDPKGVANEVSHILGKQKNRRDAIWDS